MILDTNINVNKFLMSKCAKTLSLLMDIGLSLVKTQV